MGSPEQAPPTKVKPGAVVIGFLVLLIGEIIILSNAGLSVPDIQPAPITEHAEAVDFLTNLITWVVLFFFVLTQGLLVYFCIKYRARDGEKAKASHTHGHHTLELAWTFIPGLILFALAVFQMGTWGDLKFRAEMPSLESKDTYVVRVLGKQFEWHFWYPGPDREWHTADDVVKGGQLVVPVDKWVVLELQTIDVLHSFWLPNARVKQDLLGGQTIPLWFKPYTTGEYPIVCAELCGEGHTNMSARLLVQTEDECNAWLAKLAEATDFEKSEDRWWQYWREVQTTAAKR